MVDEGRRRMLTAGIAPMVLSACGSTGAGDPVEADAKTDTGPPPPAALELSNGGRDPVRCNLDINGRAFAAKDADLLAEIGVDASTPSDLDVVLAIWRFLVRNRRHSEPYTSAQWGHSPTLLLNSIGSGYCDDSAAALAALCRLAGREARVWSLTGHVVPEVLIAGRWAVFDPDLEVYYLDDNGLPAGIAELAANPRLIENPVVPTGPHWATELLALDLRTATGADGLVAYSRFVADIYSSTANNSISPWYDDVPPVIDAGAPLLVPPGATLSLGDPPTGPVAGIYGTPIPALTLTLKMRGGTPGAVQMPFVLRAIHGDGQVALDGEAFDLGSAAFAAALGDRERCTSAIEIVAARGVVLLEYLLNMTRFPIEDSDVVTVEGEGADGLSIRPRLRKVA